MLVYCNTNILWTWFRAVPHINSDSDDDPAKDTSHTNANGDLRLDNKEHNGTPEDNLQAVEDQIRFQASPSSARFDMLSHELVSDNDERFGTLDGLLVTWSHQCLEKGYSPFLGQLYSLLFEAGLS